MADDPFSLSAYGAMLGGLRGKGYAIADFHSADIAQPHLVLRHDVDFDLDAAAAMAAFEAEIGVRATYFVLLRTEFYNPFSAGAGRALARIAGFGHRIGLHFDAALHPGGPARLAEAAGLECDILGRAVGREIEVLSLHRPHPDLLDNEFDVPGVVNAYGRRFFRDMGYCSDSRGAWRRGHPLDHPAVREGRALQLLTHPIWWVAEDGQDPQAKLEAFLRARNGALDAEVRDQCDIYGPVVPAGGK